MHWITADDGNGNLFEAQTKNPDPEPEHKVACWIYIDSDENGWKANEGTLLFKKLKKADNGHFMA